MCIRDSASRSKTGLTADCTGLRIAKTDEELAKEEALGNTDPKRGLLMTRRFKTELSDVEITADLQVTVDSFLCQRIPQEMGNPITISHSQTDQSKYTQFRSQQLARFGIYSSFLYQ